MTNPAQCITIIGAEYGAALGIDRLMAAAGYEVQRADDLRIAGTLPNRPGAIVVASCTPNAPPLSMISSPRSSGRDTPILILAPWASDTGSSAAIPLMGNRCTVEPFAPTEFLARLKTLVQETAAGDDDEAATLSFGDYKLPNIADIPELRTVLLQSEEGYGPYAIRGIGEGPHIPVAAAVANAVRDASGARVRSLPVTSEKVYRALHDQTG